MTGAAACFDLALLADPQGNRERARSAEPRRARKRGPTAPRLPSATAARLLAALGTTDSDVRFARGVEAAFRAMWRRWCA